MKFIKISFLFLFIVIGKSYTQVKNGNLDFRSLILKPKNSKDLIKGYNHFILSKEQNLKDRDTNGAIYDLRLITIALRKRGLFYESEGHAIEALKLLDTTKKRDSISNEARIGLYNNLGLINKELNNCDVSISYFDKVIRLSKNTENTNSAIKNRSNVLYHQNRYEEAIEGYLSVLNYSLAHESNLKIARLYDNLGIAQSKIKNSEALSNLDKGLQLRKKENYYAGILTSYLHLVEHYKDRNDIDEAKKYANKAITIAKESKNKYYEVNALSAKIALSNDKEVVDYKNINDSIEKAKQLYKNQFASNKYNFLEEQRIADELKIANEKQKFKTIIAILTALIIALLSVFFYFILKTKHKKEKLQQVYTIESELSKKVHDGVANDIFHVMTKLESKAEIGEDVKTDMEYIYDKARDISKQLGPLHINDDFKIALKDLMSSYNNSNTNVVVKGLSKIDWKNNTEITLNALYKVLQELFINMKKHSKASVVAVIFKRQNKKIIIIYKDDGVGCYLKKGTGLQNVENRIKAIGGHISFETEKSEGFKATITV